MEIQHSAVGDRAECAVLPVSYTHLVMKKLAKDKMLRAISDHSYASTRYEQEMTQEALLAEAKRRMAL